MKSLLCIALVLAGLITEAQSSKPGLFKKEFTLLVDNDNFLMNLHDGYYTNGIFLKLNMAALTKSLKKKIINYELGQLIFTTENRRITSITQIDRPYTGYLYFRYGQTLFSPKHIIKWSGQIGTIGPASGGQQVQELYHKVISVYEYPGWETQLKTEPGINVSFNYMPTRNTAEGRSVKIIPAIEANLGTTFINVKGGAYLCVGAFENNENSSLWDASTAATTNEERKRKYELFGFFYPHILVQGYNATVQGGMFRADKGGYVSDINHLMYQHIFGFVYLRNRIKMQVNIGFQTKEAKSQRKNHHWAGIGGTFRFN